MMEWLTDALSKGEPIAIDTETTGLDQFDPDFKVRLVQFGTRDEGWAVPLEWYHRVAHEALELICNSPCPVVFHNATYDVISLRRAGLPTPPWGRVEDTRILAHLDNPAGWHGLKQLATQKVGRWAGAGKNALATLNAAGYNWSTYPVDAQPYWAYGVLDTIITRRLYDELPVLPRYTEVMGYVGVMLECEYRGLAIDMPYVRNLEDGWIEEKHELADKLLDVGIRNPNANRQIENVLVQAGWEPDLFTDLSGEAKLDKLVLESLADEYPWVTDLLRFKQVTKWLSSYIHPMVDKDVVHPKIKALGAVTGRTSVGRPPFHQLPARHNSVRRAVVPRTGKLLAAIDYRSQEPRIMAHHMGPGPFSEGFARWDDPYLAYAHAVEPGNEAALRSAMKPVQLGISYGAGPATIAKSLGSSEDEARAYLNRIFAAYPDIKRWIDSVSRQAEEDGYVTTIGGRSIPVPEDEAYKGVNYICQGSGADVIHDAVNRLNAEGLGEYILMDIHDEILFEFPEDQFDECVAHAVRCMERDLSPLPLLTETSVAATDWSQTK